MIRPRTFLDPRSIMAVLAAGSLLVNGSMAAPDAPASSPASSSSTGSAPAGSSFDTSVKPILAKSCTPCHNDRLASGSLSLSAFSSANSIAEHREEWERILQKIRTGEMPPKGMPRPPQAQLDALMGYVRAEFEAADRKVKPDPGRVTARRLNRSEYTNTIRDLLAVDFRADKEFPTDDSGYGFDNIGDVLTVSPVLMEKYLVAAERIASRAIGADPLPKKPVEAEYHTKDKTIRRLGPGTVEATHRIEWDGEYIVRIGLPGQRGESGKPVTMGFWMDGKLLHTAQVETKPSKLVYFNPYSEEEFRLVLPEGDHTFRAGFIDDDFVRANKLSEKEAYSDKTNKFLNMIKFVGPYPAKIEKASRKKIMICDPASGQACVEKIVSTLAHRAYRRPLTRADIASLMGFVRLAKAEGQTVEQGIQLAIQAMLVSPNFLFRIERDPAGSAAPGTSHPISDLELASRLSYFLWSSMPDDELLSLAETKKLRAAGVLDAQVARMLKDERAAAFAGNFAGQWLETRNLDSVKPDPQKFPTWRPELRDAMKQETQMLFEHILRENRPISEFLNARYTFLNEPLAKHYGIEGVTGPDFRRVELANDQRRGVLTHASVLTVSSYPTRTSPVIRGKYVLQNMLGAPPPPPPADVPSLDEESVGSAGSLRQQMEKHRASSVCASCHNRMDALGFGLENYDAIGRWRSADGKFPIDAAGTLPNGKSFKTPSELVNLLNDDLPEFSQALIDKMLTFALGRGLERYDRRTIESIDRKLAASEYKFQTIIYEIVHSLPFQSRRGEALRTENTIKQEAAARR